MTRQVFFAPDLACLTATVQPAGGGDAAIPGHAATVATDPGHAATEVPATLPLTIDGPEAHHLRVKRIEVGESVDLVDGAGWRATATLTNHDGKRATFAMQQPVFEPAPTPRLVLIQALVKGSKEEQVVQMATEVGADAIITWQAGRSISRWADQKCEKQLQKLREAARAATKQSRRSRIPQVEHARNIEQIYRHLNALTDQAETASGEANVPTVLVAHESATERVETVLAHHIPAAVVGIVIGPEGGISEDELAAFQNRGAHLVMVGDTVMRAVTAGVVTLALVRSAWQRRAR